MCERKQRNCRGISAVVSSVLLIGIVIAVVGGVYLALTTVESDVQASQPEHEIQSSIETDGDTHSLYIRHGGGEYITPDNTEMLVLRVEGEIEEYEWQVEGEEVTVGSNAEGIVVSEQIKTLEDIVEINGIQEESTIELIWTEQDREYIETIYSVTI